MTDSSTRDPCERMPHAVPGSGPRAEPRPPDALREPLALLNGLFIRALKALAKKGEADLACRIAAEAWSFLRRARPEEAERLNGALHALTRLL